MNAKDRNRVDQNRVLHKAILAALEDPRSLKPHDRAWMTITRVRAALEDAGLGIKATDKHRWGAWREYAAARRRAALLGEVHAEIRAMREEE